MQWHHDTPNTIRALGYFTHPTVGAGLPSDETWFRFCSMACFMDAAYTGLVPQPHDVNYDYEADVRPSAAWCHVCHCYLAVRDSDDYYA